MKRVLTAEEMSASDFYTINEIGIPSMVLMERAALSVVEEILLRDIDTSKVLVVCGLGNNGGDGVAVARILAEKGIFSELLLLGESSKRSDQQKAQLHILEHYALKKVLNFERGKYSLIIDALFGIGLSREIAGQTKELIEAINSDKAYKVAIDIPSGIDGSSGQVMGCAFAADLTVTFEIGKLGQYLYPGKSYCGELVIKDIGICVKDNNKEKGIYLIEKDDINALALRDEYGNKSTFGKLLVIAGSKSICGAAYLASCAALKCGIGMVKIITDAENRTALSVLLPEALIETYDEHGLSEASLRKSLEWADAVVIGPGIGTETVSMELFELFCKINTLPAVLDADALNLLSAKSEIWNQIKFRTVITPHIGEMSRLTSNSADDIKSNALAVAAEFSKAHNTVCVLKDAISVVAYPDGGKFINTSGCSALASAGSDDVLSGILGAMLLKKNNCVVPAEAVGVYYHGVLGETCSKRFGNSASTSTCLLDVMNDIKIL